jgi:translation initiation factor 2-alpha kinase 4
MSRGQFAALKDLDDSSSSSSSSSSSNNDERQEEEEEINVQKPLTVATSQQHVPIPSYEDLSTSRADEETVLSAVYGSDFTRQKGTWGCPKLQVLVRPPELAEDDKKDKIGCELTLSVQLGKRYPYVVPTIELLNVRGLSKPEQAVLLQQLKERMIELSTTGTVMVIELVQLAEDFVLEHNQDPTLSAWEQMKAREAKEKEEREQLERQWLMEQSSSKQQRMTSAISPKENDDLLVSSSDPHMTVSSDIQRELARQREAIDAAANKRNRNNNTSSDATDTAAAEGLLLAYYQQDDDEDDDDGFDFDEDDVDAYEQEGQHPRPPAMEEGAGRYRTDFIELGILGRGGGGEVVKVRNRLDRRICTY